MPSFDSALDVENDVLKLAVAVAHCHSWQLGKDGK
jgi:hypothetical protein